MYLTHSDLLTLATEQGLSVTGEGPRWTAEVTCAHDLSWEASEGRVTTCSVSIALADGLVYWDRFALAGFARGRSREVVRLVADGQDIPIEEVTPLFRMPSSTRNNIQSIVSVERWLGIVRNAASELTSDQIALAQFIRSAEDVEVTLD